MAGNLLSAAYHDTIAHAVAAVHDSPFTTKANQLAVKRIAGNGLLRGFGIDSLNGLEVAILYRHHAEALPARLRLICLNEF